jgi:hypothetical protein
MKIEEKFERLQMSVHFVGIPAKVELDEFNEFQELRRTYQHQEQYIDQEILTN